jgi:hypothetical protein
MEKWLRRNFASNMEKWLRRNFAGSLKSVCGVIIAGCKEKRLHR